VLPAATATVAAVSSGVGTVIVTNAQSGFAVVAAVKYEASGAIGAGVRVSVLSLMAASRSPRRVAAAAPAPLRSPLPVAGALAAIAAARSSGEPSTRSSHRPGH
jgi:hypothetical protein